MNLLCFHHLSPVVGTSLPKSDMWRKTGAGSLEVGL